jgi:hypothetical protein
MADDANPKDPDQRLAKEDYVGQQGVGVPRETEHDKTCYGQAQADMVDPALAPVVGDADG